MRKIILCFSVWFSLTTNLLAQVPNYVPKNGLMGWWPFNGNANDESGNGNNGTVNGATLTNDRFGKPNKAYNFVGDSQNINIGNSKSFGLTKNNILSINFWTISNNNKWPYISKYNDAISNNSNYGLGNVDENFIATGDGTSSNVITPNNKLDWMNICVIFDGIKDSFRVFINGNFVLTDFMRFATNISTSDLLFGPRFNARHDGYQEPNGNLDDIGIWNRPLTQEEITNIYNAVTCENNTKISTLTNNFTKGSAATFTATTSDPNPNFIWQSDFGQGFVTLNNFGKYSGANSNKLTISNVQLANHQQPIRVISTSGKCTDTSNVVILNISDTCISNKITYDTVITNVTVFDTTNVTVFDTTNVTVFDTTNITVFDSTFLIETFLKYAEAVGLTDSNTLPKDTIKVIVYDTVITNITVFDTVVTNFTVFDTVIVEIYDTIRINICETPKINVYPNPTNSFINVDLGNSNMSDNYSLEIFNALGQIIYKQHVENQFTSINLASFCAQGVYMLRIINNNYNKVETHKIVLKK